MVHYHELASTARAENCYGYSGSSCNNRFVVVVAGRGYPGVTSGPRLIPGARVLNSQAIWESCIGSLL